MISHLYDTILLFVREQQGFAAPIVFLLAFGESLAVISLLLPASILLFGIGGLIGVSGIGFWPIWGAAVLGAVLGDWLSYWAGQHFQHGIANMWPLSRHPRMLPRGHAFFEKWGFWGIFLGRFFGPLRSVVPLVAGICAMPQWLFQIANVTSALVWASGILLPGVIGLHWLS